MRPPAVQSSPHCPWISSESLVKHVSFLHSMLPFFPVSPQNSPECFLRLPRRPTASWSRRGHGVATSVLSRTLHRVPSLTSPTRVHGRLPSHSHYSFTPIRPALHCPPPSSEPLDSGSGGGRRSRADLSRSPKTPYLLSHDACYHLRHWPCWCFPGPAQDSKCGVVESRPTPPTCRGGPQVRA